MNDIKKSPFSLFLCKIIDEQVLCVHGGLSPEVKTLDQVHVQLRQGVKVKWVPLISLFLFQIRVIDRGIEIPHEGAFCDLVWSDPEEIAGWAISPRGAGYLFGASVTQEVWRIDSNVCLSRMTLVALLFVHRLSSP